MKINKDIFQYIKEIDNSIYGLIKPYFLYHSNKLEGSTFSQEELIKLVDNGKVIGDHDIDDVYETLNSIKVFDLIIDTLDEPLTPEFLKQVNSTLERNTRNDKLGLVGDYKKIPNRIRGCNIEVSMPKDVPAGINNLLEQWNKSEKQLEDITVFHAKFEHIHPFQDGNGRTGRFIILKQCIENDIDLVFIDSNNNDTYKAWLEVAQTQQNCKYLTDLFKDSQACLEKEFEKNGILNNLNETIKCIKDIQEKKKEHIPNKDRGKGKQRVESKEEKPCKTAGRKDKIK